MKPKNHLGLAGIFISLSLPLAAQTWNGATANWSTASNWTPSGVPAPGANITIADTTVSGLTLDGSTSRSVGSITFGNTGTRISAFTLQTNANSLTISGGLVATGAFTTAIGPRVRGNIIISADQTWQVGGDPGTVTDDRGITLQDIAASSLGTLTMNANATKTGTGQLTITGTSMSGAGNLTVDQGTLKLNAGSSVLLTSIGTGKFIMNNASSLFFAKNSGTFGISRAIQFNGTTNLGTGGTSTTTGTFDISSNMEWNGTHTITNNNSTGTGTPLLNYQFLGVMSGSGALTKNGPSTLILGGAGGNTHTGNVTVTQGELGLSKTGGAGAIGGNLTITGGIVRMNQPNQIANTSSITVTGGQFIDAAQADTIASLSISSAAVSSLSGLTVTGATTLTNGTHDVNSGQTFTTNSLAISNNATLRPGANTGAVIVNVGAGGLTLDSGKMQFGNAGAGFNIQLSLSGNLVSTGTSSFTAPNTSGPRVIDLQAGSRSFAVNSGTLTIGTTVQNGTLVKSGVGTLILPTTGSTGDFSFNEGPTQITTQATAGNVTLAGGTVLMDVGGATPAKLTTSGNFTATSGSIDISAANGAITPGVLELVRYGGTLTGTPTVNIPTQLTTSRMNPVLDYGTGTNSAITLTSTAVPLSLTWHGATASGLWDTNTTANFNSGAEKFYSLDSVTFGDTAASASVLLNSTVFPADVVFNHGTTLPTYTVSGTGSISGPTRITKNGTGTTILATNNNHTAGTDVLVGTLQVGNGGLIGSLGTGSVLVDFGANLRFSRDGTTVVANVITGGGTILNNTPGTTAFTANSTGFFGATTISSGNLQLGDGGADGSLGGGSVEITAGTTFTIKRTGNPTISNSLFGDGSVVVSGGGPILTSFNSHTGGNTVKDDGHLRVPGDYVLGSLPLSPSTNNIRLNHGGLKNMDSDTTIDNLRGITITGEAYFTAGWIKTLVVNSPITGTGDVFINYDTGKVVFADATSDWTGVLTLGGTKPGFNGAVGGNLQINSVSNGGVAGPLGKSSADPANLVFNGGRLIYAGDAATTDRGFTLTGAGTIEITGPPLAISGVVAGAGTLTKVGTGTLVLSGATSTYTGNVIVDNGTLAITNTNALGASSKTLIIAGDAATSRVPEVQVSGGISPTITELQVSGAGVGNLTGALHNVSGSNTLNVTGQVILRAGNGNTTLFSEAGTLTINTPLVTANTTGRILNLAGAGNGLINGPIVNGTTVALPVVKAGLGTWTLNGAHTYSGPTTVNEGVLSLGQAALNDTAAVTIAAGATLNLNFSGNDRVGSLTINGVAKPDGLYNATTDPGFITGSGNIRVGPEPSGYGSWAAGAGLTTGVNDGPTQDPDNDGIKNLLEYVLGGTPIGAGASNTSIMPTQSLTATDLIITFPRSDASETDVTLQAQWSDDMAIWHDFAAIGPVDSLPAVDITEDSPNASLDTVVVTIPRNVTPNPKLYGRVRAVK